MTDDEVITALSENPKLIERPIVVNGKRQLWEDLRRISQNSYKSDNQLYLTQDNRKYKT